MNHKGYIKVSLPKVWCLYGKKRPNDPWTKLGASSFNNQPEDMLPNANSKPTRELPFRLNNYQCKDMQYPIVWRRQKRIPTAWDKRPRPWEPSDDEGLLQEVQDFLQKVLCFRLFSVPLRHRTDNYGNS